MMAAAAAGAGRVLVTRRLPTPVLDKLRGAALDLVYHDSDEPMPREALQEAAKGGLAGIYCLLSDSIDADIIKAAGEGLKVVATMSAGYNHIDVDQCNASGVAVGYTPDVLSETTADLAVALALSAARRVVEAADAVKAGKWTSWKPMWLTGKDVFGSTVGIVGLGSIGAAIARRLKGFGCTLQYTGGSGPKPSVADPLGATHTDLDTLLSTSDFVILSCALTPATRHLIDEAALGKMKSDAVLVNIARGEVVDQDALVKVLQEGGIYAAGLDVTTPEPLDAGHPLLSLPNAVVLPHIGSASHDTRMLIANMAADNIIAGVAGQALPHPVPASNPAGQA